MAPHGNLLGTIHVLIGQENDIVLQFKIGRTELLNKIFQRYKDQKKIFGDSLKFRDKNGLQLSGYETPASLGMQENDLIVAFFQQDICQDKFQIRIGLELDFTVDRYLMLKRLFNEFADRTGLNVDRLQFLDENGNKLEDTDSPGSLNMAQNALIRAVMQPQELQSYEADNDDDETIQLKICIFGEQFPLHFRIKRSMPLGRLFQAYAYRIGFELNKIRFLSDGQPLSGTNTPASLGLESGHEIWVYKALYGGSYQLVRNS